MKRQKETKKKGKIREKDGCLLTQKFKGLKN